MRFRREPDPVAAAFRAAGRPGRSLDWRKASWCAIDFELTGLDPDVDDVIAVGCVPIESGRIPLAMARYTLIASRRRSSRSAILTHKLRVDDLRDAPPLAAAVDLILGSLSGRVPIFHAAGVEQAFLGPLLRERGIRLPEAVDTEPLGRLWLARQAGTQPGRIGLERLAERLGQRAEAPHHALGDALTTAQVFIALASKLELGTRQTVGTLLSASSLDGGGRRMG